MLPKFPPPLIACFCMALALFQLMACQDQEHQAYRPAYSKTSSQVKEVFAFGVHPLHNPQRLHEVYDPLMDYINARLEAGVELRLEASRNYDAYDEKLLAGAFAFALPNPYQTVLASQAGYRIFGKMGNDADFRGIILVRKDSGIETPLDLKGRAVSFPAPTALAATMMPQYFLHEKGLRIPEDIEVRYVGSQESSIQNVYMGQVAAGATWPPPWRAFVKERPAVAAEVEVRWRTEPLPNNGLVVREDIAPDLTEKVAGMLFDLHNHAEGREILARMELERFEPASEATYAPVRSFLKRFDEEVRPLDIEVQ